MNWLPGRKGPSGFSSSSTAEEVTHGIDATSLTAIVTVSGLSSNEFKWLKPLRVVLSILALIPCASSGIGMETARVLALRGAHVIIAARNVEAGTAVKEAIIKENNNARVDVLELDLSSIASVHKFVTDFKSLNLPLNILINNAGVMGCPFQLSPDGIEQQFATNHIGHFLLTNLLLEKMKVVAHETGIEGRVINLSSGGHKFTYWGGIRFDKISDKSGYYAYLAYGQSKLANILHANELARRLQEEGANVTANSVHPGSILTNLQRNNKTIFGILGTLGKFALKSVPQGAATTCYVALHPQLKGVRGKYFVDSNEATPSSLARDPELAKKLWKYSESITS